MKKLLFIFSFLFCVIISFAQTFPNNNLNNSNTATLFGYQGGLTSNGYKLKQFADTASANAVLYLKFTPHLMIKVGNNIYVRNTAATQWILVGGNFILNPGVDSITLYGNNLCQWVSGVSTCYAFNNSSFSNYSVGGDFIYDSLLYFHNTAYQYYILGRYFTAPYTSHLLTPPNPSAARNDAAYVDTLSSAGIITGVNGGGVPSTNPVSQFKIGEIHINAADTVPSNFSNVIAYRFDNEWSPTSAISGFTSAYATAPFTGTSVSMYVPSFVDGETISLLNDTLLDISNASYLKVRVWLGSSFSAANLNFSFNSLGNVASTAVPLLNGQFGYTSTIVGSWQEVNIPMAYFQLFSYSIDEIIIGMTGANASGFKIGNVVIQFGGLPTSSAVGGLQSVRTDFGPHVNFQLVDTGYTDSDTSNYVYKDRLTNTVLFTLPTYLKNLVSTRTAADTCIVLDTLGRTIFISFNQNCGGSGGGSQDLQSVTDIGYITTNPIVSSAQIQANGPEGTVQVSVSSFISNIALDIQFDEPALIFGEPTVGSSRLKANRADGKTWQLPDSSGTIALLQNITSITFPNTTLKYLSGYNTFGSFYDSARAAHSLTTIGTTGDATYSSATGVTNIPNYALSSWNLGLNSITAGTDRFGTSNNTSVNIYTNNTRSFQFDSLGTFNMFPGATPKTVWAAYRNSSTTNKSIWLNIEAGYQPVFTTNNSELVFKTNHNSGTPLESFRLEYASPTSTMASLPQAIVTGKLQAKVGIPSTDAEKSYGFSVANTSGLTRGSIGIDSAQNIVWGLGNVGWRLYQDNIYSQLGDFMKAFPASGNIMIKNRNTYTEATSARLNVESNNQGVLIPRMTTVQRDAMLGSIISGVFVAGSGYTNGTYTNSPLTGGTGTGATADITVSGGIVTGLIINNTGTGYLATDVLNSASIGAGTGFSFSLSELGGVKSVVANIATGLLIFDTDSASVFQYNGSAWQNLYNSVGAGSVAWGAITGTLSNQTDLNTALGLKAPLASPTFTGTVTIPTPFTLGATSVTSTGTQLNYLNAATGTTGTASTNLVFSTTPTFTTNITTPLILGGTGTTQTLTYQTTSGVGATGANHIFKVGIDGATTAMTITNAGNVGVGMTPVVKFDVTASNADAVRIQTTGASSQGLVMINADGRAASFSGKANGVNAITYIKALSGNAGDIFQLQNSSGTALTRFDVNANLAIGTSAAPTAVLHLKSGTTAASTSPIKLALLAPALNTTAEKYAVEVDSTTGGGNIYYTNASATRYTLAKTLTATATLDFGSTLAGAVTDLTITVTGAADGDAVTIGVPNGSYPATGTFNAWVSAANTVTIRYANNSLTLTQDPASGTFRASVIKY